MSEVFDVVVVGAGAAGLVCASLLHEQKLRVKLLEGSALLGGRMYARDGLFPWPIDLGGEFIHGGQARKERDEISFDGCVFSVPFLSPSSLFADILQAAL